MRIFAQKDSTTSPVLFSFRIRDGIEPVTIRSLLCKGVNREKWTLSGLIIIGTVKQSDIVHSR